MNVNLLFHPIFDVQVIEETDETMTYVDLDGVKRIFHEEDRRRSRLPLEYPISDWASWNRLKQERLNPKDVKGRFPRTGPSCVARYRNRDFPLVLGGYPQGTSEPSPTSWATSTCSTTTPTTRR